MRYTTFVSRSIVLSLLFALVLSGCADPVGGSVEQEVTDVSVPSAYDTPRVDAAVSAGGMETDAGENVEAVEQKPAVSQAAAAVLRARPIFSPPWGFKLHRYIPQPE
jgi:hypothetical protein